MLAISGNEFSKTSGLVTETVLNIEGLRLFCVLDGGSAGLDPKFEDIAFLVHGSPEIIRFGDFKRNGLIAD